MYSETVTQPIRDELKQIGIQELTGTQAVKAFMQDPQAVSKAVLINSVCGCAAGTARPGFFKSLSHPHKPKQVASVFAGVDKEAVETFRTYLPGIPPSSPAFAFFREGALVHFLGRSSIEGANESLLAQSIGLIYSKYFGATIDESITVKDPFALVERDVPTLRKHLLDQTTTVLDCRDPSEREQGSIEPSTILDEAFAQEMLQTWAKDKDITVYCQHGDLSLKAALYLRQRGFTQVFILAGGFKNWEATP